MLQTLLKDLCQLGYTWDRTVAGYFLVSSEVIGCKYEVMGQNWKDNSGFWKNREAVIPWTQFLPREFLLFSLSSVYLLVPFLSLSAWFSFSNVSHLFSWAIYTVYFSSEVSSLVPYSWSSIFFFMGRNFGLEAFNLTPKFLFWRYLVAEDNSQRN